MITTVFKNILQKDINISFTIKKEDDKWNTNGLY
jgi:hypothetical protein